MTDLFYRAFEERYYAPREVIKKMRCQYLPFLTPLITLYEGGATFDAGCGRGEWLELMQEKGFSPFGVDLDEGMLQGCRENDLPSEKGDAVEYLSTLPDASQVIVTAFHVVEHIPFDKLRFFVKEAFRVLKPGGVLIMETPNPENIFVAAHNFYLDPTHKKPIPPGLLAFLTEHEGFLRNRVVRLQEDKELKGVASPGVYEVLTGVSPDYAVLAQKPADDEILTKFDDEFFAEYGLSLYTLSSKHDEAREARFQELENAIQLMEEKTEREVFSLADRVSQVEARANKHEQELRSVYQSIISQVESKADKYQHELHSVYESKSWRVTAPLRRSKRLLNFMKEGVSAWVKLKPGSRPRRVAKALLLKLKKFVVCRPKLKALVLKVLFRFPRLHNFIRQYSSSNPYSVSSERGSKEDPVSNGKLAALTPRARKIYSDIQKTMEQNKESQ